MKKLTAYLKLSVLIFALPVLFSCGGDDENPMIDLSDPSTFPGTYKMVELTDKTGELSGAAGTTVEGGITVTVPYTIAPGQTVNANVTITHTLTLTATTYSTVFNIDVNVPGVGNISIPPQTDSGTYTLNGNQLTTTSTDDGEVEVNTVSVENGRLVYENDEIRIVYKKQ